METETEPTNLTEAAALFRKQYEGWNDTPEERASTRNALISSLGEVVPALTTAEREGADIGAVAAGGLAFVAETLPLMIAQIAQLEERIACLEEER